MISHDIKVTAGVIDATIGDLQRAKRILNEYVHYIDEYSANLEEYNAKLNEKCGAQHQRIHDLEVTTRELAIQVVKLKDVESELIGARMDAQKWQEAYTRRDDDFMALNNDYEDLAAFNRERDNAIFKSIMREPILLDFFLPQDAPSEMIRLWQQGQRIEAIKIARKTKLGLKQCKDITERYMSELGVTSDMPNVAPLAA